MPNPWFRFKQFTIWQDQCAMKVSTDACIQGAWAAAHLAALPDAAPRVLDIGTGTGLLALMLQQQRPEARTEAIELNEDAARQAAFNFTQSPWATQIQVRHSSLAAYLPEAQQYDFIICNPPFFHNQLQAPEKARNDARHSISLGKTELAAALAQLLQPEGQCCILYPEREWQDWIREAALQGLYPCRVLNVRPNAAAGINRIIGIFTKAKAAVPMEEALVIYEADKSYTPTFAALLRPYYLHLYSL